MGRDTHMLDVYAYVWPCQLCAHHLTLAMLFTQECDGGDFAPGEMVDPLCVPAPVCVCVCVDTQYHWNHAQIQATGEVVLAADATAVCLKAFSVAAQVYSNRDSFVTLHGATLQQQFGPFAG